MGKNFEAEGRTALGKERNKDITSGALKDLAKGVRGTPPEAWG